MEPHASTTPPSQWGDWRLGDLVAALGRVTELIRPSARTEEVTVRWDNGRDEPVVSVSIANESAVDELLQVMWEADLTPHALSPTSLHGFWVDLGDMHVEIRCMGVTR